MVLTTFSTVFKRDKKRAPSIMVECPTGRSGSLQTPRKGKSPVEPRTAVPTEGVSSDAETGSPVL